MMLMKRGILSLVFFIFWLRRCLYVFFAGWVKIIPKGDRSAIGEKAILNDILFNRFVRDEFIGKPRDNFFAVINNKNHRPCNKYSNDNHDFK